MSSEKTGKRWAHRIKPWIASVALVLGMLLTLGNLSLLYFNYQKDRQALIESRPSFNEFYAEVSFELVNQLRTIDSESDRKPWLSAKRIIETPVWDNVLRSDLEQWIKTHESAYNRARESRGMSFSDYKIVFLDITQRGKRLASNVVLEADFVRAPPGGARMEKSLMQPLADGIGMRRRTFEPKPVKIELGSFEIGDNIVVPLFFQVTVHAKGKDASGIHALGDIFIPKSIRFTDSVTGEVLKHDVRKMLLVPIYIEQGITYKGW